MSTRALAICATRPNTFVLFAAGISLKLRVVIFLVEDLICGNPPVRCQHDGWLQLTQPCGRANTQTDLHTACVLCHTNSSIQQTVAFQFSKLSSAALHVCCFSLLFYLTVHHYLANTRRIRHGVDFLLIVCSRNRLGQSSIYKLIMMQSAVFPTLQFLVLFRSFSPIAVVVSLSTNTCVIDFHIKDVHVVWMKSDQIKIAT